MSQLARSIISKNVQTLRIKRGFTREGLSLQISKDNSYISKLEKCKVNIAIDTLEKISEVLEVELVDLIR